MQREHLVDLGKYKYVTGLSKQEKHMLKKKTLSNCFFIAMCYFKTRDRKLLAVHFLSGYYCLVAIHLYITTFTAISSSSLRTDSAMSM